MLKRLLIISLIIISVSAISVAGDVKTLDEAKVLSVQTNRPILLEFYQDDCEYCSKAAQDAINIESMKKALESVVHLTVLEKSDYGQEISREYFAGIYFPVFYVINSNGEIIKRWTGYTTPEPFISNLNKSLAEPLTLEQRINRFDSTPAHEDAIYLAKYYTEIWDYLKANRYYSQARSLSGRGESAYAYEIFKNAANAAWQDTITFEQALPYADTALIIFSKNPKKMVQVAQIMIRLGRKLERTENIIPYINAAIKATEGRDGNLEKDNILLKSESALYIEKNSAKATTIKKSTLSPGWENKPDQFYSYSKWCLERKINLEEAESFARKAVNMASPGKFRGKILSTLSSICDVREKHDAAVQFIQKALENDPGNKSYSEKLAEFKEKL